MFCWLCSIIWRMLFERRCGGSSLCCSFQWSVRYVFKSRCASSLKWVAAVSKTWHRSVFARSIIWLYCVSELARALGSCTLLRIIGALASKSVHSVGHSLQYVQSRYKIYSRSARIRLNVSCPILFALSIYDRQWTKWIFVRNWSIWLVRTCSRVGFSFIQRSCMKRSM